MIFTWAGWDFCATRTETVTVIATQRCCILSATCWRVAIVHSLKHTQSSASLVAIGRWLTRVTLLISNISAPSLVRGQCQALRKVQDCVGHGPALNCRPLCVSVLERGLVSHIITTRTDNLFITWLNRCHIRQISKKAVIPVPAVIYLCERGNVIGFDCLSFSWSARAFKQSG